MSGQFRLHPEPGTERSVPFRPWKNAYHTIRHGHLGTALLLPHVLLPIYGIYVATHRSGYWTAEFERGLAFVIALIQGLSFGSVIALIIVRFSSSGKAIKGRRIEKTATEEEDYKQFRIEFFLRVATYIFLATILWEYLVHSKYSPVADEQARDTSSGFLTASGSLRRFLKNESILPGTAETRDAYSGLGLDQNLADMAKQAKKAIDDSPRIRIPGTGAPPKSIFLEMYEKVWKKLTSGPRPGLFEIGPKTWT